MKPCRNVPAIAALVAAMSISVTRANAEPPRLDRPRLLAAGAPVSPLVRTVDARTLPRTRAWHYGMPLVDVEDGQEDAQPVDLWRTLGSRAVLGSAPVSAAAAAILPRPPAAFGVPALNVAGIDFTGAYPPDPTGDVGPSHYVQAVNGAASQFAVYDKTSGALLAGPSAISGLASGICAGADGGDPQVLYDPLADRWLFSYIAPNGASNGTLCVLISSSGDPTSTTWRTYPFAFGSFPDYPKLAVWDNAYGLTLNLHTNPAAAPNNVSDPIGVRYTFATLDRARMLAGQPATALTFQTTRVANNLLTFAPITPVGLKGFNAPKPGAPLTFVVTVDDELAFFQDTLIARDGFFDQLYLYTVVPNFDTPASSLLTGPVIVDVQDFQFQSNQFPLQPSGAFLPSFTGTPMHRSTYRNLGDSEDIVLAFADVVDNGTLYTDPTLGLHVAPAWLHLRRATPAASWSVADSGHVRPGDPAINRFLPGIGIDSAGNLAMAYSVMRASPAIAPSLWYTGKLAGDPMSSMPIAETVLGSGASSQAPIQNVQRWGDYFDLTLDPDGCRYWFTGEYMDDANWGTRIAAWKHDTCGPPDFALSTATTQFSACSANGPTSLPAGPVHLDSQNAFWRDVGVGFGSLPAGISASVTPVQVRPSADVVPSISVAQGTASGQYAIGLAATASPLSHTLNYSIDVDGANAGPPALASPADGATSQPLVAHLSWAPAPGARGYVAEWSTSSDFSAGVSGQQVTGTSVDTGVLQPNKTYFWRVRSRNLCGEGGNSVARSFVTQTNYCTAITPTTIADGGSLAPTLTVPATGGVLQHLTVRAVVNNIRASDLRLQLTRLSDNTTVTLLDPGCSAGNFGDVSFDDGAAASACAGSALGTTRPSQLLSSFDGTTLSGSWRLSIADTVPANNTSSTQYLFFCLQPRALVADAVFTDGFE